MALEIARVRSDFAAAAADGKIDEKEAKSIVRHVKENKLTESEANTFRAEAKKHQDQFDPGASKVFGDFSKSMRAITVLDPGPRPNPGGLKDPAVIKADQDRLEQQVIAHAELFRNGVSEKDPEQLYIGDCYLLASMSAVAHAHPEIIEHAFKSLGNGKYEVTLYDGHLKPTTVTIDHDLPRNDWYGAYYATAHDKKELWPALLEKAFATRAGSYGKIEGGMPGDAMRALTGKKSVDTLTRGNHITADAMFEKLDAAMKAHQPTTAATYGESSNAKYTGTNIFADHTYTVLGTSTEGGVKYVTLRNPWGNTEPTGNGRDDGIFKLDMPTFMNLFWGISVNG